MTRIFQVKDKSGRIIYLSHERWSHTTSKHPEIANIEDLMETVLSPLIMKQDPIDVTIAFYYRFKKQTGRYSVVVVKYLNGEGFILTSFYAKRIRT